MIAMMMPKQGKENDERKGLKIRDEYQSSSMRTYLLFRQAAGLPDDDSSSSDD